MAESVELKLGDMVTLKEGDGDVGRIEGLLHEFAWVHWPTTRGPVTHRLDDLEYADV